MDFGNHIDKHEEFEKLRKAGKVGDDVVLSEEQDEAAEPIVVKMLTPYQERERGRFEGPASVGDFLKLREDFYSYAFLYELKRDTLFKDGEHSDPDGEDEVKLTEQKVQMAKDAVKNKVV